jgi:hypothetical protein
MAAPPDIAATDIAPIRARALDFRQGKLKEQHKAKDARWWNWRSY